jgi:hypothetical protein
MLVRTALLSEIVARFGVAGSAIRTKPPMVLCSRLAFADLGRPSSRIAAAFCGSAGFASVHDPPHQSEPSCKFELC